MSTFQISTFVHVIDFYFIFYYFSVSGVDTKHNRLEKNNDSYIMATEWKQVEPNEEIPFFFQRREKIRHKVGFRLLFFLCYIFIIIIIDIFKNEYFLTFNDLKKNVPA